MRESKGWVGNSKRQSGYGSGRGRREGVLGGGGWSSPSRILEERGIFIGKDETPFESVDFFSSSTKQITLLGPGDKGNCFVGWGPHRDFDL